MSDLTSELNLSLAVDADDTADYLTIALADSLGTLDGLFNQATGHNHSGSHQGGILEFLDLTVGEDLTVVGQSILEGPAICQSNLTVQGNTTVQGLSATNLDVSGVSNLHGAVTMQGGLNVIGSATLSGNLAAQGNINGRYLSTTDGANGAVYCPDGHLYLRPKAGSQVICDQGALSVSGGITAGTYISAGAVISGGGGDISANRGNNTGYCFLGNGSHYIGFDGANYQMPTSNLYVNGDLVVLASSVNTLNNKTLVDPKLLSQAQLGGGSITLPNVSGNAGMWRYIKAWGGNCTILLTNGTLVLGAAQYSSGQYILVNGDSLSIYCDGSNWWVL